MDTTIAIRLLTGFNMENLTYREPQTVALKQKSPVAEFDTDKVNKVKHLKVLMYHRIIGGDQIDGYDHWTGITAEDFEIQMMMLEHLGYTAISFNDVRLYFLNRLELPKKPIILTFDDGYKDFYDYAAPILQKYGYKAVLFAMGDRSIEYNVWDESEEIPPAALLNNEELIELHSEGFEIGAHSMSHPMLAQVSKEKAKYEIWESKEALENLLNDRIYTFCYPYGIQNGFVRKEVKKAGFCFGCSVYTGPYKFGKDFYNIRRITIRNQTTLMGFALSIFTPNEYYKLMHSLKNVLYGKVTNTDSE